MPTTQDDIDSFINDLQEDDTLVTVVAANSDIVYTIQKTFLATASLKLADQCDNGDSTLPRINDGAFRIFLGWLLCRKIDDESHSQLELAMAWNFGREYEMPEFQDEVMKVLVPELQDTSVCPRAVHEAYRVRSITKLKNAFVAQLAVDMLLYNYGAWSREKFVECGIDTVPGFLLDLNQAMPEVHCVCEGGGTPGIEVEDFLLTVVGKRLTW